MKRARDGRVVVVVLLVAAALAAGQLAGVLGPTASAQSVIAVTSVRGPLPVTDPASDLWTQAAPADMPLSGQAAIAPVKVSPFVPSLRVRALANETHAAFLVTWSDTTKDNRTTGDMQFRDALAIMFGAEDATPFLCMGGPGTALHVTQWKADWQADIEEGFRDVEHQYPNFWVDTYPYAIGSPPYRLPDAFPEAARVYLPGWYVGNPFSEPLKVTAVEDAIAEGFGTLATQAQQDAIGRGVHSGTEWSVVIARPLGSADGEDVPITSGSIVAFAVWDGSSGDVGARKSVSSWAALNLLSPPPEPVPVPLLAGLAVLAVVIFFLPFAMRRRRQKPEAKGEEPPGRAEALGDEPPPEGT